MTRIDTGDRDILEYREPIGWGVLISLPVFLVLAAWTFFWFADIARDMLQAANGWALLVGGVILLVMGLKVLSLANDWFVCLGVSVDRREGTVTKLWGPFFALPVRSYNLRDFRGYQITCVTTRTRGSVSIKYYLYLTGRAAAV